VTRRLTTTPRHKTYDAALLVPTAQIAFTVNAVPSDRYDARQPSLRGVGCDALIP